MIYPNKKLNDKDRLIWWIDSHSENSYTLLEEFTWLFKIRITLILNSETALKN